MLSCKGIVEAYDTADDLNVVFVAFLDYLIDIVSIPDVAYLFCRGILGLERNTVFLLKIDDHCIKLAVIAKLDGFIETGTCSDIKTFDLVVHGSLNICFRYLGKRAPVRICQGRCLELLRVIYDGIGISSFCIRMSNNYRSASCGLFRINTADDLNNTQGYKDNSQDRRYGQQDREQLSKLHKLFAVSIIRSVIYFIIIIKHTNNYTDLPVKEQITASKAY